MPFRYRILLAVLALLTLYGGGVATRLHILQAQELVLGEEIPFTLESALFYRRVKMFADRGRTTDVDPMIGHPEGIHVRRTYTYGAEPFHAWVARWLPGEASFATKVRWVHVGWFSVSIPALALWIFLMTGRFSAGLAGGAFYAVSIAAVIRSTGQELSHENVAIPWLVLAWMFDAWARRKGASRRGWDVAMLSGVCLAAALWMWDMIQFYLALWTIATLVHALGSGREVDGWWKRRRLIQTGFVVCVAILNPYYRSQGLIFSPLAGLLVGTGCVVALAPFTNRLRALAWGGGPLLATLLIGPWTTYGQSYSHFSSLVWAKLRFMNVKPADPGLLSFDQRVMWVPALHSTDWALTLTLFPAMVLLIPLAAAILTRSLRKPPFPGNGLGLWYLLAAGISFVLFVRFHVYLALFGSALLGLSLGWALSRRAFWIKVVWSAVLALGLWVEVSHTLGQPERWGRPNVYYREMKELSAWLEQHVAPYPVMANMGISGAIAAYGKSAIVLHPKFETKAIRDRYRRYGELLFGDSEEAFRDFLDELEVRHYVYSLGEFATVHPEYQMRYFVDRMDPPESAPARKFEFAPETLEFFYPVFANRKYAVYTMRTREDERMAQADYAAAVLAFQEGRLEEAERLALRAWERHPGREDALDVAGRAASLLQQGFRGDPGQDD
ncbi:MAG TPA: hypothetical protein PKE55_02440 [Kiritimatiellia bacterium]|nr:hypothetical protein [Kiritimatiellia bacterium]